MRLSQSQLNIKRRTVGRLALVALILAGAGATLVAWAGDAPARVYDVQLTLDAGGQKAAPRVLARAGEPFAVSSTHGGVTWTAQFTLTQAGTPDGFMAKGKIDSGESTVARPALLGKLGAPVRVRIGDADKAFDLAMVVTEAKAPGL